MKFGRRLSERPSRLFSLSVHHRPRYPQRITVIAGYQFQPRLLFDLQGLVCGGWFKMPALLEDPETPVAYRQSGQAPYPTADNPQIPSSIFPRPVTLRDRVTIATLIPFFSPDAVPQRLLAYLAEQLNKEIEGGDTYPMMNPLPIETFGPYWFGNFGAIMVLGDIGGIEAVTDMDREGADWNKLCLGSFYVKPNYPGRSSHVCNGGFLVTPAARNKGVGKSMGQCYLDWAPQLVGWQ